MSRQKKRAELLTYGYTRQNYQQSVPITLINLFKSFYDENLYWIITGEKLKKFKNCKHNEMMFGPTVTIKDIKFQMVLFPKGFDKKSVYLFVCSDNGINYKLPENVENIQVLAYLCCENTKAQLHAFNKSSGQYIIAWHGNKLLFTECLQFEALYFYTFIDLRCIFYKTKTNIKNYVSLKKMRNHINYTWDIDDKLARKLTNASIGQIVCLPSFDHNNWSLTIYPNGLNSKYPDINGVCLKLLNIPNGIGSLVVEFTFNYDALWKEVTFDHKNDLALIKDSELMTKMSFDDVSLSLLIKKVIHENGNEIHNNDWPKYGIIDYIYCAFIYCPELLSIF